MPNCQAVLLFDDLTHEVVLRSPDGDLGHDACLRREGDRQ